RVRPRACRRHRNPRRHPQSRARRPRVASSAHEERGLGRMIARFAFRSLTTRPLRTGVLAAGFGLGIGVMAALLGVGQVILEQANSPALIGGGDLLITAPASPLENARYVIANTIGASALAPRVAAVSPWRRAPLYLIVKPGVTIPVSVRGGIPSLEKALGEPE